MAVEGEITKEAGEEAMHVTARPGPLEEEEAVGARVLLQTP